MTALNQEEYLRKINSAIIGTGYISGFHIDAIRRSGLADVVAVHDTNYKLAQEKARENSIQNCYKDLRELLNNENIEVIHNCTPNNLHFDINRKIIESGKHVFSEKPLIIEMRQKIINGDIGKPLLVHGSYLQNWLLFDTDYNWRVDSKVGGISRCLSDMGLIG